MKSHVIQDEPGTSSEGTIAAPGPAPGARREQRVRTRRVLLIVCGAIALLLLVSGVAAFAALGERDENGYFMTGAHRLSTPSSALVSDRLDIDTDAPDWLVGSSFATSRIEARSSRPVFLGIGRSADVDRYLARVRHAQITDFDTDPFRVTSHVVPGGARPAAPASQDFWRVRSSGSGTRTVTWPVERGTWSVAMMNADGSRRVDVHARLGARVSSLGWIAAGLTAGGLVALLVAAGLLRLGPRPRRPARH